MATAPLAAAAFWRPSGLNRTGALAAASSYDMLPVTLTATEQDVYPPRVLLTVVGLNLGDSVELYRVVGGERTAVRAGADLSVDDISFLRVDAELPFGVPVSYVAVVNGVDYSSTAITYSLPGGKVALSDAISGDAAEVVVLAWPEKKYQRESTTFRVGGRNVVVSGDFGGFEGTAELYTGTTSSLDNLMELLNSATEGVIQIRQPGGYDGVDGYVSVTAYTVRRWSQDGTDERRVTVLEVVEVEGWAAELEAAGYTYADLAAVYEGQTYADLAADYPTYLALAQGDFS